MLLDFSSDFLSRLYDSKLVGKLLLEILEWVDFFLERDDFLGETISESSDLSSFPSSHTNFLWKQTLFFYLGVYEWVGTF
jgi:hypothetical protein